MAAQAPPDPAAAAAAAAAPAPAAMGGAGGPAAAAPGPTFGDAVWSVVDDILFTLGLKRRRFKTPETEEEIDAAYIEAISNGTYRYNPPPFISTLKEMAATPGALRIAGIADDDVASTQAQINDAISTGEAAHRSYFILLHQLLLFLVKYGNDYRRSPGDSTYARAKQRVVKALRKYLWFDRQKYSLRADLEDIASSLSIPKNVFKEPSESENSAKGITIPHLSWRVNQALNEFVAHHLTDEERAAARISPGGGVLERSLPPRLYGDLDAGDNEEAYDAEMAAMAAVDAAAERAHGIVDWKFRPQAVNAAKALRHTTKDDSWGNVGKGAGAVAALLAPSAAAAGPITGGGGGGGSYAEPAAPYTGLPPNKMMFGPGGVLRPEYSAAAAPSSRAGAAAAALRNANAAAAGGGSSGAGASLGAGARNAAAGGGSAGSGSVKAASAALLADRRAAAARAGAAAGTLFPPGTGRFVPGPGVDDDDDDENAGPPVIQRLNREKKRRRLLPGGGSAAAGSNSNNGSNSNSGRSTPSNLGGGARRTRRRRHHKAKTHKVRAKTHRRHPMKARRSRRRHH